MNSGTQNKYTVLTTCYMFDDLLHVGHCLVYFSVPVRAQCFKVLGFGFGFPGFGD